MIIGNLDKKQKSPTDIKGASSGQETMKTLSILGALTASLLLAACHPGPKAGKVDAARLTGAASDGSNWMSYGRTYDEQRYSPLTQVNLDTVSKLGVAWHHEFDTDRGQEATPVVVDGVLYTTAGTRRAVVALNAVTGELLWWSRMCRRSSRPWLGLWGSMRQLDGKPS